MSYCAVMIRLCISYSVISEVGSEVYIADQGQRTKHARTETRDSLRATWPVT